MPKSLFVYGTLMLEEIFLALTGQKFKTAPATLQGYQRHSIIIDGEPASYPAIKPATNKTIQGLIIHDLTDKALAIIEHYENSPREYQKTQVQVTDKNGNTHQAQTYVALPHLHPKLKGTWNPQPFIENHLQDYTQVHIPQMLREMNNATQKPSC